MFSSPEDNVKHLNISEGMTVADFGTGSGAYAIAMGKIVGPRGTVYAIDVQKDLLAHVMDIAARAGVNNVKTLWGVIDEVGGTKLHDRTCDAIAIASVLFQSENKEATAKEAFRLLKPKGEVLLIDWSASSSMGPSASTLVSKEQAQKIFTDVGFTAGESFNAGANHYGMVFKKST